MTRYRSRMETIPEFPELQNLALQMTENWKSIPDWEPDWKKMRGQGPAPESKSPVEVCVHGLTAKFFLDLPDDRIIPSYYLKKAERTVIVQRTPWCFRNADDARDVDINKWSPVDIHFRSVFMTLRKLPEFGSLYDEDEDEDEGYGTTDAGGSKSKFDEMVKLQGQVVYALLQGILEAFKITRETDDSDSYFFFRTRLLNCQLEYWVGYSERYKDGPLTAGLVGLDHHPDKKVCPTVLPVSASLENISLRSALEDKLKLMLGQLLLNISRLRPHGDQIPDQEVYLIGIHGSRLHILRAIFLGQKTSHLWSGRHNRSSSDADVIDPNPSTAYDRFYTGKYLERLRQQVEWLSAKNLDNDPNPRNLRVLGSREFDLWRKQDFRVAVKMIVALFIYMMSGRARCGVLQKAFQNYPIDEGSDDELEEVHDTRIRVAIEEEELAKKEKELEETERKKCEEEQNKAKTKGKRRSSIHDRFRGFKGWRKPCEDFAWQEEEKANSLEDDDL
ncbi:hypothetical protein IFM58399_04442 [Aspergillus lentulus]|uniref:Uncharacterized protein n=1 Tax=Aspergillus lentulus TaxID=293939 RepID=A0AAN5YUW0_ASPLE|nr:uncharacterized protein IFM58399_04442 [Aspergillus lentulus]KAF4158917.1 hypothetical protein CNMCM6069_003156 [Aspergillus lentulus]KAF4165187.1 hypothetical protein CNMCM6936_008177 [Aspergillus lentulus]KAF4177232.1 hypothetical protein CNMCM8060_005627 [Aspergillus lentulus]KAF4187988.1 hypothetical protein CNMCM7927_002865 [Aspergillus lentulus]KAF4197375.1 hypothetical protein CNMCM8694_003006 [Aspergillus lentulus]